MKFFETTQGNFVAIDKIISIDEQAIENDIKFTTIRTLDDVHFLDHRTARQISKEIEALASSESFLSIEGAE